jgi:hypothetical protein
MTSNRYKVIFDGKIVKGRRLEEVKRNLALFYKIDSKKIERLFAKRPIVIRKDADPHTAIKYRRAFEKAGVICEIVPIVNLNRRHHPPQEDRKAASLSIERKTLTCPNCGHEQEEAPECLRCGIIFNKYEEMVNNPPLGSVSSREPSAALRQSSPHVSPWLVIALVVIILSMLFGIYKWWTGRTVYHGPGIVAANTPKQEILRKGIPFSHKDYLITPVATFWVEARVLSIKKYRSDRESDLAPVDLALGWGPMSDEAVLKDIEIGQSNRFYFWRTMHFPIPRKAIEENSANMHLIPEDRYLAGRVNAARRGNIVVIKGYLVNVGSDDDWHWRSSLTRKDTGPGACELIWVEEFETL